MKKPGRIVSYLLSGAVFAALVLIIGFNIAGIAASSKGTLPELGRFLLFAENSNDNYNVYRVEHKSAFAQGDRVVFKDGLGFSSAMFQRITVKRGENYLVLGAPNGGVRIVPQRNCSGVAVERLDVLSSVFSITEKYSTAVILIASAVAFIEFIDIALTLIKSQKKKLNANNTFNKHRL